MSSNDTKSSNTTSDASAKTVEPQQFDVAAPKTVELEAQQAPVEPTLFEEARFQRSSSQLNSDFLDAKKLVFQQIASQQAQYIGYTSETIRFPINLLLSLNVSAIIALLVILKWVNAETAQTGAIEALGTGLWCFSIGGGLVLLGAVSNFLLSNHLANKNREILASMFQQNSFDDMVQRYVSSPSEEGVSNIYFFLIALILASFVFFIAGAAAVAGAPMSFGG